MKAATLADVYRAAGIAISIHAAREGGDRRVSDGEGGTVTISIHAAREGGDLCESVNLFLGRISIHAAREGGDYDVIANSASALYFNPRRP